MMDVAHKYWWQTFEVIAGIPFLTAIVLHYAVPLSFPQQLSSSVTIPVGIVCIIGGVILITLGRRELAQHHQPTDPGHPTSRLVMTGVFSISRNLLYLGGICIVVGLALLLNLVWVLALLLPALVACHYVLILPEERYLAAKFGAEYDAYTNRVHRWIGRQ